MAAMAWAFPLLLLLLLSSACADRLEAVVSDADPSRGGSASSAMLKELEHAKIHISILEEGMQKRDVDLQKKDSTISSLQAKITKLQKKEGAEAEAALKSIKARLNEQEAKVVELERVLMGKELKLELSKVKVQNLEAAQNKLTGQIKRLEKAAAEQEKQLEKAERTLNVAEAAMKRVQEEANAKRGELLKMHSQWLPHWAWSGSSELQAFTSKHWVTYGKPIVAASAEKVSQKAASVHDWSKPHIVAAWNHVEQKWLPVVNQNWEKISTAIAPHVETTKMRAMEGYTSSKEFLAPHFDKAQVIVEPYVQATKESCRPYVDMVVVIVQPYFEQAKVILKPYTKHMVRSYKKTLKAATSRHHEVQSWFHESMKNHDILAPWAHKELVWFLASAVLLLPALGIFLFLSSFSSTKKPAKHVKSHHAHQGGKKKHKRVRQADK